MKVPLGFLMGIVRVADAAGEAAQLHHWPEHGARDGQRGRKIHHLQKRRVLVGQVPDEHAAKGLAAARFQPLVTGDGLVQSRTQPLNLLRRQDTLAQQIAITDERVDLVRRGENFDLPGRETLVRIAHPVGPRMPPGDHGLLEWNAHAGAALFAL